MTLCSGIGALELAASWLGWRHIMTCEINTFCRRVLEYHYPEAYHHYDIKTLNYETIEKELSSRFGNWREGGTVLVAGFPCQPFSCAGKRLGAEDDRYLWDEVKRILAEVKPDWFIGENVAGILSMVLPGSEVKVASYEDIAGESYEEVEVRQQSVVERICLDLESIGYSVVPFVIPACAVGAHHRRDRIWFVARRDSDRCRNGENKQKPFTERKRTTDNSFFCQNGITSNAESTRSQRQCEQRQKKRKSNRRDCKDIQSCWHDFPTQSPVCGRDDGLSFGLSGITFPRWRTESIKALGNSMVPQVVYELFKAIEYEQNKTQNRKG